MTAAAARARRSARLAALGAAALAGACTEGGGGPPPFPGDGVAGFGAPALVDVCIGPARAVPGGAAAVCVPEGAEPQACVTDDQCARPERCQCGRCLVNACSAGQVCPAGEACRGGRCTTACTEDAGCAAGEICRGGGCTRACGADSDCRRGEVCDPFGACAVEACSPQVACGAGYTCEPLAIDGEVREPTFVEIGGAPVAFFELRAAGGAAVYRARRDGPLRLVADPATPVLGPPPGATRVGGPSALARGEHVELFVAVGAGAALGRAASEDGGRSFAWVSEAALVPEQAWEAGFVGAPAAFERDGETFVLYEGGAGAGIGLAAVSGQGLARAADGPVLVPSDLEDASFWRSVQSIGAPFALTAGGVVRVYVTARGIEGGVATTPSGPVTPEPNDSIGLFASEDLAAFDRYPAGPVYTTISGLFGAQGEREPAVRATAGGAELYFVATDASGAVPVGLARASTAR